MKKILGILVLSLLANNLFAANQRCQALILADEITGEAEKISEQFNTVLSMRRYASHSDRILNEKLGSFLEEAQSLHNVLERDRAYRYDSCSTVRRMQELFRQITNDLQFDGDYEDGVKNLGDLLSDASWAGCERSRW